MATIVAVYLSGSRASMVWPVLVCTVEVVMFAFVLLLMLTVELALPLALAAVVLLVSVADWQPASPPASAAAAKIPLATFARRMKIFSSLFRQRWSTTTDCSGAI